jgi:isoamylase
VFLNGRGIPDRDARGQPVRDDSFILCFNAHYEPLEFTLPPADFGTCWRTVLHTGDEDATASEEMGAAAKLTVGAHTAVVLQAVPAE